VTLTFDLLTSVSIHSQLLPCVVCLPSLVLIAQVVFLVQRRQTNTHTHTDATDRRTHASGVSNDCLSWHSTTPTPKSSPTSSRGSSRECRRVVQFATGITSGNPAGEDPSKDVRFGVGVVEYQLYRVFIGDQLKATVPVQMYLWLDTERGMEFRRQVPVALSEPPWNNDRALAMNISVNSCSVTISNRQHRLHVQSVHRCMRPIAIDIVWSVCWAKP